MNFLKSNFSIILISVAVVVTGFILGKSYLSKGKADPEVSVVGLGETSFDSDLIVWESSYSTKNYDLKQAYANLNRDNEIVMKYFNEKGIPSEDIIIEAADINKNYSYQYNDKGNLTNTIFEGYTLNQRVKVQSNKVDLVEKVSREVSQLIDKGIELNSFAPDYYYTQLAALKLDLIESATNDAKERASKIVENGGGELGDLKQATMGVFQITAENSSEEYSWGGSFNTSSRRKTANITIRLTYEID